MKIALFLMASLCAPGRASAQQPDVINAKVETRALTTPLAQEFHRVEASVASPVWLAYTVPMVPHQGSMCGHDTHNNIVRLEGPDTLVILLRFENHAFDRIVNSSLDCQFDAGGLPFTFLTGVQPSQSVDLLAQLARTQSQSGRRSHFDSLIAAVALNRDPSADRALQAMLLPTEPESLREKALFWLANARGRTGFEAVKRILQNDPSEQLRDKASFDLTVTSEPEAIPLLVEAARSDHSTRVRSQALFWLAQKAGHQQSAFILQQAQKDTDAHVRRQAIFALKEIPSGEGIPLLIQLAKTSPDSEVRKQALFWLSQSKDPKALKFFADAL